MHVMFSRAFTVPIFILQFYTNTNSSQFAMQRFMTAFFGVLQMSVILVWTRSMSACFPAIATEEVPHVKSRT